MKHKETNLHNLKKLLFSTQPSQQNKSLTPKKTQITLEYIPMRTRIIHSRTKVGRRVSKKPFPRESLDRAHHLVHFGELGYEDLSFLAF